MKFPVVRDLVLFLGGVAGVAHETIIATSERPTLLILFAAMMGLPAFLRQDQNQDQNQGPPDPPAQATERAAPNESNS